MRQGADGRDVVVAREMRKFHTSGRAQKSSTGLPCIQFFLGVASLGGLLVPGVCNTPQLKSPRWVLPLPPLLLVLLGNRIRRLPSHGSGRWSCCRIADDRARVEPFMSEMCFGSGSIRQVPAQVRAGRSLTGRRRQERRREDTR